MQEVKNFQKLEKYSITPTLFDYWIDGGYGYIIMEKIDETLNSYANTKIPISKQDQLIDLFTSLYNNDISYPDITTANIGFVRDRAVLIDLEIVNFEAPKSEIMVDFYGIMGEMQNDDKIVADKLIKWIIDISPETYFGFIRDSYQTDY